MCSILADFFWSPCLPSPHSVLFDGICLVCEADADKLPVTCSGQTERNPAQNHGILEGYGGQMAPTYARTLFLTFCSSAIPWWGSRKRTHCSVHRLFFSFLAPTLVSRAHICRCMGPRVCSLFSSHISHFPFRAVPGANRVLDSMRKEWERGLWWLPRDAVPNDWLAVLATGRGEAFSQLGLVACCSLSWISPERLGKCNLSKLFLK
jgi:hypothetical protein